MNDECFICKRLKEGLRHFESVNVNDYEGLTESARRQIIGAIKGNTTLHLRGSHCPSTEEEFMKRRLNKKGFLDWKKCNEHDER